MFVLSCNPAVGNEGKRLALEPLEKTRDDIGWKCLSSTYGEYRMYERRTRDERCLRIENSGSGVGR